MKLIALQLFLATTLTQAKEVTDPIARFGSSTAIAYANHAHICYSRSLLLAEELEKSIVALTSEPSESTLKAARHVWVLARHPYLQTEAFRFYSGPIDDQDGPEGLLNAWPLDERYIDQIINNPAAHPELSPSVLRNLNELEGEANIATGYHAIEYLLWGADTAADGPGARPATDFSTAPHADRRRAYLSAATELLLQNLRHLVEEWAPENETNYRSAFLAAPPEESLKKILTGLSMLAGFEMASERLLVAYDTQAQEDEHSCFSDTTHHDILHDLIGIEMVGQILNPLTEATDAELATKLSTCFAETVALAKKIPVPFDQAILGDDTTPGRRAILVLIEALEDQADLLVELSSALGFEVPISE